ncbi:MAG: hypothetical protein KDC92_17215, partial [Bacteroidetes bacterium]|nr:hypothetical protein [Bacteroidota bacterium]
PIAAVTYEVYGLGNHITCNFKKKKQNVNIHRHSFQISKFKSTGSEQIIEKSYLSFETNDCKQGY